MPGQNRDEILDRIVTIVIGMLQKAVKYDESIVVTKESELLDDLGFDSIMLIVLQVEIEDTFHIRFNPVDEDLQQIFMSVQTLADYVQDHIGE